MFLLLNGFQSDCVLSCRRLHRFWKSCGESRSSWKVSRSKRSSSLDLILKLRRAADEHVLSLPLSLSCLSQSSTPSWILEETRISAAEFLPPRSAVPERCIEAAEPHRTAGGCSGAQTERVHRSESDPFLVTFNVLINICTFLFLQTHLDGDFSSLWLRDLQSLALNVNTPLLIMCYLWWLLYGYNDYLKSLLDRVFLC